MPSLDLSPDPTLSISLALFHLMWIHLCVREPLPMLQALAVAVLSDLELPLFVPSCLLVLRCFRGDTNDTFLYFVHRFLFHIYSRLHSLEASTTLVLEDEAIISLTRLNMALRPSLLTRGLSSASGPSDTGSPAEQRDDAKKNMLKAMRPLPTQHYWNVYFDR